MDGHFVDNLTFGPDIVAAFRRLTELPLDVHLMISEPARYIDRFIDAEPQTITFHIEATAERSRDGRRARRDPRGGAGCRPGRQPGHAGRRRSADRVDRLDVIMVMTVEPGWGGQGFMPEMAPKIAEARRLLAQAGRGGSVHVDGGVNHKTAEVVGRNGIDVCVVGSALFQRGRDASEEVDLVREAALAWPAVFDAADAPTGSHRPWLRRLPTRRGHVPRGRHQPRAERQVRVLLQRVSRAEVRVAEADAWRHRSRAPGAGRASAR